MKKYLVVYHAPAEAMAKMATATEEEKMEGMKPWMAWKDKVGDKMVDFGSPLMPGQKILPGGNVENSTKEVTGYSLINANSIDEAKSMLSDHPHLQWHDGCDIEVHECMPM